MSVKNRGVNRRIDVMVYDDTTYVNDLSWNSLFIGAIDNDSMKITYYMFGFDYE